MSSSFIICVTNIISQISHKSFLFPSQICANLDSAIVSTKNYAPELKKKVPRPVKTFDIVDKRPMVSQIDNKTSIYRILYKQLMNWLGDARIIGIISTKS